ncbi:MAG: hypothetical protein AAF443_07265 [Chlamydiota bacterium]
MAILYSSIPVRIKQKALFRGSVFSGLGLLLLLVTGVYGGTLFLQRWGIWIFGIGISLIAVGLIPYRRLCFLETHPHQIIIEPAIWTVTAAQKTVRFSPKAIQAIHYIEKKRLHGIRIDFYSKNPSIFLPFFSRKVYETYLKSFSTEKEPFSCNFNPPK